MPTVDGYYVDMCYCWCDESDCASNCNMHPPCIQRAADALCRRLGYSSATSFVTEHRFTETMLIGSSQKCQISGGTCGGFTKLDCL